MGRPSVQDLDGNTIFVLDPSGNTHRQSVRLLSTDLQFAAAILIQRVFRHWQHAQATDNDTPWSGTSVVALQYLMFLTHVSGRSKIMGREGTDNFSKIDVPASLPTRSGVPGTVSGGPTPLSAALEAYKIDNDAGPLTDVIMSWRAGRGAKERIISQ